MRNEHQYKMSYTVRIHGNELKERLTAETQSQVMEDSVRFLVEELDLLDKIELPKLMNSRAILNTVPKQPNGTEMARYEKLADDCYLFLDLPSRSKKAQMKKLGEICDAEVTFENW
jgi:hypothetical protein